MERASHGSAAGTPYRYTASPSRSFSGLKLIIFGAAAPLAVVGAAVGGMLLVRTQTEPAAAVSDAVPDCRSPRYAWRAACQTAAPPTAVKAAPGEADQGTVIRSIADREPATTGSIGTKGRRSSTGKGEAEADPSDAPAREGTAALPRTAAAAPAAASLAPPSGSEEPTPAPAPEPATAPPPPPAREAAAKPQDTPRPAAGRPAPPAENADAGEGVRIRRPVAAEPGPTITPRTEPPVRLRPVREARKPTRRARTQEAQRVRTVRREQTARGASPGVYVPGGVRVVSTQTYYLPDGRQVTVHRAPRPEIVRELMARHAQAFPATRPPAWRPYAASGGWD